MESKTAVKRNIYLRVMKRIVYFSLMLVSIAMRKVVERILGFRIGQISLDKNMIEHQGWVSWLKND